MKKLRTILFILVPVLLVMILPTILLADSANQIDPTEYESPTFAPDAPSQNGEIPSIDDGVPYEFPLVPTAPDDQELDPSSIDQLGIDIWYGDTQTFSELGSPQLWANILGTVTGLDQENPAHSLTYTLNGGEEQVLNIGPDTRRLYEPGEFNIELPVGQLIALPDVNVVVIKADDGSTTQTKTVTVRYVPSTTWPMPYTADWSSLGGDISKGAQIVDGRWEINNNGNLAITSAGYDRLVTLGDYFWKDYEVKVPITVRSWNTDGWEYPSNGGGIGLAVRWRGHFQTPANEQPRLGWSRLGALAWFRLQPRNNNPAIVDATYEMLGHGGGRLVSRADYPQMEIDKTYWFKVSVQSSQFPGQPSTYRFKVWESGTPEPSQWTVSSLGRTGEPQTGAVLLVAHQVIAEYGDVEVTPLPEGPFTINVQDPANGDIVLNPSKPSYSYGEKVQIRAVGDTGYKLANWTQGLSGDQNPIIFDVTQNLTVGANFAPEPTPPQLNITVVGSGNVTRDAQPPYKYGDLVRLTPNPGQGYIFAGWGGDLTGIDNPASIVLDTSKNVIANFVPTSTSSPQSDDFNACALNDDLWDFINPLGDGVMLVNGTELQLSVPAGVAHDVWETNDSVRVMQNTQNDSFEIVTKFDSSVTSRYQMQGILVEQDANNFLRFDAHYDGQGVRLYVASIVDGTPAEVLKSGPLTSTPPYLRVTRDNNQWTYSYSVNGNTWTSAGSTFNRALNVTRTGVFAANQAFGAGAAPAHTAIVDYFFNTSAPIVPEDGNQIDDFTIQVESLGEGTVSIQPNKATYQCNDVVLLTASPAAGWVFSGWSGDLSGSSPQQQITVEQNYNIVANFTEEQGPPPPTPFKNFFPMVSR